MAEAKENRGRPVMGVEVFPIKFAYMVKWVVYFSVILFGAGCSSKLQWPNPKSVSDSLNGRITILCYNIHHCNPPSKQGFIDIDAIKKIIIQHQPDLVALQEVDVNTGRSGKNLHQSRELAKQTGMHEYFGKAINYDGGEYGIAILSKYPLSDTSTTPLPTATGTNGEPRTLALATVTLKNGKKLIFANTHLDAQRNDTNRILQINLIIDMLHHVKLPVVIAGDFNAVPGSRVIDALDKFFTRTCTGSCPFTIPVINPVKTIDFIAFAPATTFKVVSHKVINEQYASDHLPVLVVLQLQ
jgi:endonuclease/exonuclease/phosphatase family metal-dependent hydrolase